MSFRPAVLDGQSIPPAIEKDIAASQDYHPGALLLMDGGLDFAECGADPASIAGVSLGGGGPDTEGYRLPADREYPPGRAQAFPIKDATTRWTAEFTGTLGTVGTAYGVVKDTDDIWRVDFTDTVATRVILLGVDQGEGPLPGPNRVLVSFLAGNIQTV